MHHFNIRAEGINTNRDFIVNICAQIIERYKLGLDFVPDDAIANSAFLRELLDEASGKLVNEEKIVLVIDGLDEIDDVSPETGRNILNLPVTLPSGVFIVVTMRNDKQINLRIDCEQERFPIVHDSECNVADIQRYIKNKTNDPSIQSYIAQQKIDEQSFTEQLSAKSEGNFMYIRYVLPEIANGAYTNPS